MSATSALPETPDPDAARRDALRDRLNQAMTGALELYAVYLGERLGLYDALADGAFVTAAELAARTDAHERYVREWLEQQTLAGIVEVDDRTAAPGDRRFRLPAGHVEVLTDRDSLNYWTPQARLVVGGARPIAAVLEAFRTGGGVPYAAYGADLYEGLAEAGRVAFLELMGSEWLPAMPDIHARLHDDPPARVADIGVGAGWSSIALARAYPKVRVDAFDLDPASVELARRNIAEAGLSDRVRVEMRDAGDPALTGSYDLVAAFGCLHDMSDPVGALRAMRRLASETGTVFIGAEPKGSERFLDESTNWDVERQYYGFSLLHCLPVGMDEQPSAGTGTVMRPDVLRSYAREAGFRDVEILPIDDAWSGFYRLRS
jgi:SAM-dependent methyltransferase